MDKVEHEVYKQLLAEDNLCPEPVEVIMLLEERGAEATEESVGRILDLLHEDFMQHVVPMLKGFDGL